MIQILADECVICSGSIESVLQLPCLPLTGIYSRTGQDLDFKKFDQELMVCTDCGHGQLKYVIDPNYLYGHEYGFRTTESQTARGGCDFFAKYLETLFPKRTFKRVVEFGCNDVYLLKLIKPKAEQLLGIDPIWKEREAEFQDDKISVVGDKIEKLDLHRQMQGFPDLIISQHTMEHIEHPKELLEQVFKIANAETTFVFEFPCFDPLLEQFRFDQVFHQHIQYYSVQSFLTLLDQVGGEMIDFTFHYTYWGALLIAFRKTKSSQKQSSRLEKNDFPLKHPDMIRSRYKNFCSQMDNTKFVLDSLNKKNLYGYGAALMLPILGYHLDTDFEDFQAILDDDPDKDGMGYVNLPVKVQKPTEQLDYGKLSICLTALDNRRPILKNLASKKPKHIINPLIFL
jgi:hypothetical protein